MQTVQDGTYAQRLYKRFSVRDRIPLSVTPEILPVVIVDDVREPGPDNFSERACVGHCDPVSAAGNTAKGCLFNPPASGVIIRPIWIVVSVTSGITNEWLLSFRVGSGLSASVATERFMNSRLAFSPMRPKGELSIQTSAGFVTAMMRGVAVGSGAGPPSQAVNLEGFILDENIGLEINALDQGAAIGMRVSWAWIEMDRPVLP